MKNKEIKELPPGEHVFIYADFIEINLDKNSSLNYSKIIRTSISRNFYCGEYDFARVFLSLNDILNLKEFRMFKG